MVAEVSSVTEIDTVPVAVREEVSEVLFGLAVIWIVKVAPDVMESPCDTPATVTPFAESVLIRSGYREALVTVRVVVVE